MAEPIKLLMATHNYPRFAGDFAGVFVSLLAKRLKDHDIEPVVVAPHAPGLAEYEQMHGVKVYRFRYAKDEKNENLAYRGTMHKLVLGSATGVFRFKTFLDCFRHAAGRVIEDERINVLSGHWLIPSGMVLKTVNRRLRLPVLMYSHGTDVHLTRKYFGVGYRYLADFCLGLRHWAVVSSFLREEIVSLDPRLEGIVEVLPVPHDEQVFFKDDSVVPDPDLVVAVTRFTEQKKVRELVRAMALLGEKRPNARLELYGSGPMQAEIEQLIAKLGLRQAVSIHGPVSQEKLREVYNRASVVVLNSVNEGFGLALSEAMLCGTAVVGADSGGITDIIENEKRGLLVAPNNIEHLSEALLRLLTDPALNERLARAGHAFAAENYASRKLAGRYADIIKSAARRR
ncbi:MAG: glycosyltransferase family 4 protein [Candidatus Zixiibacteriota bacterium]|nr:MAG: glycosyltransferase family 4 protein [candidate division Zixibacteria bacterium]